MKQRKTLTEVKLKMAARCWRHIQEITINKEYDYDGHVLEGIAEVHSTHPFLDFEVHYNEGFKYNVDKDELKIQKDDSLNGIWWFTPDFDVIAIEKGGIELDSYELDEQGLDPEFSKVDYSKMIEAAKESQE